MTTSDKLVAELRHDGQVLHLLLNAPKANIVDMEVVRAIMSALETHVGPNVKAIVFEGEGVHFSFGASVEEHTADKVGNMLPEFHGLFRRLAQLAIPTLAVVRGQCLGGGMELASYCTWIFASPSAHFGQPEINLAVFAPVASVLLPWRVGGGAALDLCVSGRSITADEAHRIGLVHTVTEDPAHACTEFIEREILAKSASSLRFAERAVRSVLSEQLEATLARVESLYLNELMKTEDANEGIAAFIAKRPANFAGR